MTDSKRTRVPTMMGRTIDGGRYRVDALIGEGGMGQIYVGRQTSVNRKIALKFLHGSLSDDPGLLARFEREAKSISRLRHPNIISLIDHGRTEDGRLFMVMELLGGESLAARLHRVGALPTGTVLHIACQVVSALVEAHAGGIIHRDLKPDNIHLDEVAQDADFVKVLDFGIAKIVEGPNTLPPQAALTLAGAVFGTPQYMSPEQVTGKPIDHRSDLYAVGVIMFEMLAGRPPFDGPTPSAVMVQQATEPLPDLRDINPQLEVDDRLVSLIASCTEKKFEDRISSAVDLLAALRAVAVDYPNPVAPVHRPALSTRDTAETLGCASTMFPDEVEDADQPMDTAGFEGLEELALPGRGGVAKMVGAAVFLGVLALVLIWPESAPSPSNEEARPAATEERDDKSAVVAAPVVKMDAAAPALAWVRLDSVPAGAAVFLGSRKLGVTPLEWRPRVEATPVALRFELAGHEPARREILLAVAGAQVLVVKTRLQPGPPPAPKTRKRARPHREANPATQKRRNRPAKPAKKRRYQKL